MPYLLYPLVTIAFLLAVLGVLAEASKPALVPAAQYESVATQAASQATQIVLLKEQIPTPTPCRSYYGTAWRGC